MLLSFLLLKPTLGLLLVGLVSIWLLMHKYWRGLLGEVLGFIGLYLIGVLHNPSWLMDWLSASYAKWATIFDLPTMWGLAALLLGNNNNYALIGGVIVSLTLVILIIFWVSQHHDAEPALVLGIITSVVLLISPYVQIYDQLLIIFPFLVIIAKGYPHPKIMLLIVLISGLSFLLAITEMLLQTKALNTMIPLLSLVMILTMDRPYILFGFRSKV